VAGALGVEPGGGPRPGYFLLVPDREQRQADQERVLRGQAREAADRGAETESARIKGDSVETRPQFGRNLRIGGQEWLDLLGRAAAVEEQRAEPARGVGGPARPQAYRLRRKSHLAGVRHPARSMLGGRAMLAGG